MTKTKIIEKDTLIASSLFIIALVLGFAVYQKYNPRDKAPSVAVNNPASGAATNLAELTEDQKIMFLGTSKDSSQAELNLFSATVAKHAVAGNRIEVADCVAKPEVLQMKYGSQFAVENTGNTGINFGFGEERTYIAPGQSASITANYKNGKGIYGYGCDNPELTRAIGVLWLTE